MPAASNTAAFMEMADRFASVLSTDGVALLGISLAGMTIEYPAMTKGVPSNTKPLLRLAVISGAEKKRTLSRPSRVTKSGIVDVQVFMPKDFPDVARKGRMLCDVISSAWTRGATANVNFYKAYVKDMPPEERFFYWRVNATYNYDVME